MRSNIFGRYISDTVDDITGRQAAFERESLRAQQASAGVQGRLDLASFNLGFGPQQAGLAERARQLGGASPLLIGPINREAAGGETEYRRRQQLLPLQRESARAEREAAVAAAQQTAATRELLALETRSRQLFGDESALKYQLSQPENQSGVGRQNLLNRLSEISRERSGLLGLQRQQETAVAAAAQQSAAARGAVGTARAQELLGQASFAEAQAGVAGSAARRLGAMDPYQRQRGPDALRRLDQLGPGWLTPDELSLAQQFAPQRAGQILERFGKQTREYREGQRLAPDDFPAGDPADLRRRAVELQEQAARKVLNTEVSVAREASEAFRDLGKTVADLIKRGVQEAKDEMKTQLLLQKGAQN